MSKAKGILDHDIKTDTKHSRISYTRRTLAHLRMVTHIAYLWMRRVHSLG